MAPTNSPWQIHCVQTAPLGRFRYREVRRAIAKRLASRVMCAVVIRESVKSLIQRLEIKLLTAAHLFAFVVAAHHLRHTLRHPRELGHLLRHLRRWRELGHLLRHLRRHRPRRHRSRRHSLQARDQSSSRSPASSFAKMDRGWHLSSLMVLERHSYSVSAPCPGARQPDIDTAPSSTRRDSSPILRGQSLATATHPSGLR